MRAATWWVLPMGLAAALLPTGGFASNMQAQAGDAAGAVVVDFTNPGMSPPHWTLTLHRDGSGHFRSEAGNPPRGEVQEMDAPSVDRDIQVSAEFAGRVFQTAQRHNWFNAQCDSRLKVAFQGWKRLSYSGPEGQGTCTFNYSQDKEIQALGDSLVGVAETVREGARLEMLLQHDRLGLDKEMEYISDGAKDGRMVQIVAIKEILERLVADEGVLERVRKRARVLLAEAGA
jgi:hypothetical protein